MKALKYALTFKVWLYKDTSKLKQVQYQSINQAFRMVGSINDKYNLPLKAFIVGNRVDIDYLNSYVDDKDRVDIERRFRPSKITREQAKEQYPEWYQRVVVEGNIRRKKWNIAGQKGHNGDELYLWWLRRAKEVRGGHRYFFLMCLVIYACKCDIPKKRLREDMQNAFVELSMIEHTNPLTQDDIDSALEVYSREYYNFTIADIEKLTDLRITRNKRNKRKQALHLKLARANRDILCVERGKKDWRDGNGRPSKEQIVQEWQELHPKGRKSECIKDTGLSKPTVYKWWQD